MAKLMDVLECNERFATTTRDGRLRMWAVNDNGEPTEVGAKKENK